MKSILIRCKRMGWSNRDAHIISLDDVFYMTVKNINTMPAPINNLDLTNPMIDREIFSTNPNDFLDRLRMEGQLI